MNSASDGAPRTTNDHAAKLRHALSRYYSAQRHLRMGICSLNAGDYSRAVQLLSLAAGANPNSDDVATYLVKALLGDDRVDDAERRAARRVENDPQNEKQTIRLALLKWRLGKSAQAIALLRDAVAQWPESAEVHFQLGTLLAADDHTEEAELRFTQAVAIDSDHVDGMVAMAMCMGTRNEPRDAVRHLKKAQHLRPNDTRIAMLLSVAARAARDNGTPIAVYAAMPTQPTCTDESIRELAQIVEKEPEFVDAILAIDQRDTDESVFAMLAHTLQTAIKRNPSQADLHYQCGCVLQRLGRTREAIREAEKAVDINPRYVRALILLAKLYQQTDRYDDAATRLEQTVLLGAEYADTYYLLGNLYRDTGQLQRARWAYEHALKINSRYEAAKKALDSLAA